MLGWIDTVSVAINMRMLLLHFEEENYSFCAKITNSFRCSFVLSSGHDARSREWCTVTMRSMNVVWRTFAAAVCARVRLKDGPNRPSHRIQGYLYSNKLKMLLEKRNYYSTCCALSISRLCNTRYIVCIAGAYKKIALVPCRKKSGNHWALAVFLVGLSGQGPLSYSCPCHTSSNTFISIKFLLLLLHHHSPPQLFDAAVLLDGLESPKSCPA